MTLDRSPEDILREEQESRGSEMYTDEEIERAQQEADHQRDVEQDRQMVTEDPEQPPGLGLPHYRLWVGTRQVTDILNYSYWNCNGMAMCIAAKEGAVADWAAYIGAIPALSSSEEDAVDWTVRKGAKLSRQQAHRWFPDLPIEAYRE